MIHKFRFGTKYSDWLSFPLFNMHCIGPECVNVIHSPDADRLLIQNGALSQDGTFPVVTVLCFRPIVRVFYAFCDSKTLRSGF